MRSSFDSFLRGIKVQNLRLTTGFWRTRNASKSPSLYNNEDEGAGDDDESWVCVCCLLVDGVTSQQTEDRKGGTHWDPHCDFLAWLRSGESVGVRPGGSDTPHRYRAVIRAIFSNNPHPFHCIYMRLYVLLNRWLCIELFDTMSCVARSTPCVPHVSSYKRFYVNSLR